MRIPPPALAYPLVMVRELRKTVAPLETSITREAWLPLIRIPAGNAEASIVKFRPSCSSPLVSAIVCPERPGAKVSVALAAADDMADRSEPGPESAVVVTCCARRSVGTSRSVARPSRMSLLFKQEWE